ncbi:TUBBY-LIKE F-BOX PROTEIN [Salix viminalis]|uniref:TUBBY-LIKE F-BOX PROTEIN n=1 Tax=Salix viminalis TaxID=40686 RepID=A0A9Q0UUN8_SALVM|nr:TUBBY-LIKE F-BOX PROTEIN [Salix viminalis]
MSFKSIMRELKEIKEGIGSISRRGVEGNHWREESEVSWPARAVVVHCASVCRSWREITKEIVKTPEQCGRLTFPISLKQPGPRESPIQCFIKRDNATSTFLLYYGLVPSEGENDKLLLAARKITRATCTDFIVSLVSDDFSRASNTYVGKLRQVYQM